MLKFILKKEYHPSQCVRVSVLEGASEGTQMTLNCYQH